MQSNMSGGARSRVSGFFESCGLPSLGFCRFFGSYFTVSAAETLIMRLRGVLPIAGRNDWITAAALWQKALWTVLLFVWLSLICRLCDKKSRAADQLTLMISSVLFAAMTVYKTNSFYTGLALGAVAAIFFVWGHSLLPEKFRLDRRFSAITAAIAAAAVFIFVALTTVDKHRAFGTPCFDMGIFLQMFYSLRDGFGAVTSCERDVIMSHFNVHSSFIFYLILPAFRLFPKAETLLVIQALFAMGGALPLYLIAKRHAFKPGAALSISFIYIFCAGLILPCYYSFHENCFLPTLLMWLMYAADRRNIPLFYIMSALVCSVKEDAPLYVICIGLFLFADDRSHARIHGAIAAALSGGYFIIIMSWLTKFGDGDYMTASRLGILMTPDSGGFIGIVKNILSDPGHFLSLFAQEETLLFLCETLLPLMLLPFMTAKLRRYLLMIPYVIMCLVVGAGYQYAADIGFQYIFGPACLLIYMSLLNADDLPEKFAEGLLMAGAVISVMTSVSLASGKIAHVSDYNSNRDVYQSAEQTIAMIPQNASILSNTFLLPHACDREEIYDLGNDKIRELPDGGTELIEPERYDYLLMSTRDPLTAKVAGQLLDSGWTEYATDGFILIYQNPRQNDTL